MNDTSSVSPEHTSQCLHPIWPWSNFISYGSLEQFHLLRFLVLTCQVPIPNLQEVLATDPEPCDDDKKDIFVSVLAPPPYQPGSFLSGTWGFQASLELGTFVLSFLFIKSFASEYPLEGELICTLKVPEMARRLSLAKTSWCLLLFSPSITPRVLRAGGYLRKLIP